MLRIRANPWPQSLVFGRLAMMRISSHITLTIVGIALAFAPTIARAEWVRVGNALNGELTYYFESGSQRINGTWVRMWEMTDLRNPIAVRPSGRQYLSSKEHKEYDCLRETRRVLYVVLYAENLGGGTTVMSGDTEKTADWSPIVPGSIDEQKWKVACSFILAK